MSEFPSQKELNTIFITDNLVSGEPKPDNADDRLWKKLAMFLMPYI